METIKETPTVGIPRTLLYYSYYPFWRRYFAELGVPTMVSSVTTKKVLDVGVKTAVTDACLPVKVLHGHVADLIERGADYLFIPRVVCTNGRTVYCPKFLGLPDMIKSSLTDLPDIIDVRFDIRDNKRELKRVAAAIAAKVGRGGRRVSQALDKALADHAAYERMLKDGVDPHIAIESVWSGRPPVPPLSDGHDLRFAVLGYPYNIYDPYVSLNLLKKMRGMGITPLTANMVSEADIKEYRNQLYKTMFWTYSEEVVLAAHHYFDSPADIDGVIHVTAFSCGPDSVVNRLIDRVAKSRPATPFMTLMIDEHTGEAGLITRLEAFSDMVRRRELTGAARG